MIWERVCSIGKHFKSTLKNIILANGSCLTYTPSPAAAQPKLFLGLFLENWEDDHYRGGSIYTQSPFRFY